MYYGFTAKSGNIKTGPIPVTISHKGTCPTTCPFMGSGCYAEMGPMVIHWNRLNDNGLTFTQLCYQIQQLPTGQLWRHNQAGDLPGTGTEIEPYELEQLLLSNIGLKGFTYTHKPMTLSNMALIQRANAHGFAVNLSANNPRDADRLAALDIGPVCSVVSKDTPKVSYTPAGRKVVICPAQTRDNMNCSKCGLCAVIDRTYIIGFRAHGVASKKAQAVVDSYQSFV